MRRVLSPFFGRIPLVGDHEAHSCPSSSPVSLLGENCSSRINPALTRDVKVVNSVPEINTGGERQLFPTPCQNVGFSHSRVVFNPGLFSRFEQIITVCHTWETSDLWGFTRGLGYF